MAESVVPAIARAILTACGANVPEFHVLPSSTLDALAEAARFCGYRKPRNANGSTARAFHSRLVRAANKES